MRRRRCPTRCTTGARVPSTCSQRSTCVVARRLRLVATVPPVRPVRPDQLTQTSLHSPSSQHTQRQQQPLLALLHPPVVQIHRNRRSFRHHLDGGPQTPLAPLNGPTSSTEREITTFQSTTSAGPGTTNRQTGGAISLSLSLLVRTHVTKYSITLLNILVSLPISLRNKNKFPVVF